MEKAWSRDECLSWKLNCRFPYDYFIVYNHVYSVYTKWKEIQARTIIFNVERASNAFDTEEWFCKAEERIRDTLRNIPRQPDDARIFIIFTFSRHFFSFSFRLSARTMMQLIHLWMHVHRAADLPRSNLKVFLLVIWIMRVAMYRHSNVDSILRAQED